ncbi:isoleucine--tRNA ligase, chloroplastic mitochondrial, partial [Olea europaea subsp. europaea]
IIQRFVIVYLSNFYLDVAKDRLYVGVIAPVLPHLAEDVWQHLPFQFTTEDGCLANFVPESKWPILNERHLACPIEEVDFWEKILELRTEVNKVLKVARGKKLIGSSLEAKVYLHAFDDGLATRLVNMCASENDADTLHRIFITSQVEILPSLENVQDEDILCTGEYLIQGKNKIWVGVSRATGSKCERCWNFSSQVSTFDDHPSLCGRCYDVVSQPIPTMAVV